MTERLYADTTSTPSALAREPMDNDGTGGISRQGFCHHARGDVTAIPHIVAGSSRRDTMRSCHTSLTMMSTTKPYDATSIGMKWAKASPTGRASENAGPILNSAIDHSINVIGCSGRLWTSLDVSSNPPLSANFANALRSTRSVP